MIEAHADEIGFMIRHITKDGFLYVERVGGTDTAIARGRRVRFLGSQGEVMGGDRKHGHPLAGTRR